MPAANPLVGEDIAMVNGDAYRLAVAPESAPAQNIIPDGTEWAVALIVLGSLGFLALLGLGGFKTMLAASISTGR